ncbi:TVP38/TMEM64 family protein [Desulfuribacillus alkaliarsenatis]|uniref:TVP38/TMEM64 family membrane protein n=1 Tax=Desulfuribacillus alkaliarsenatis TaxID=766136 RepID=A0A1E5G362_9FIRM|nr:VTT domain-containing protein [Desulfuribacillus alkaliarsenatis]OEF97515.1 hypothetical protein BHF68_04730 [Desulfuribacillus alkaliarsenatis]
MVEQIIDLLNEYRYWAIIISISLNIVIAITAVFPPFVLTAANIMVFGFWQGTIISFVGEALGTIITFKLYRMGFRGFFQKKLDNYPRAKRLIDAEGSEAFMIIFSMRMMPFLPSAIVTLGGAVGKVSFITFAFASALGKMPALLFEAFSVYQVTQFNWIGKLILAIVAFGILYYVFRKRVFIRKHVNTEK